MTGDDELELIDAWLDDPNADSSVLDRIPPRTPEQIAEIARLDATGLDAIARQVMEE